MLPRCTRSFATSLLGISAAVFACGDDVVPNEARATPVPDADASIEASTNDSGQTSLTGLCNAQGFCWENPRPHGARFRSLWSSGPNDVWAVGYPGTLLHFDGTTWSTSLVPTFASFSSVWGSGPKDVWVGGYEFSGERRTLVFHFDGTAWTLSWSSPEGESAFKHLNGLWGSGPKDVWAVGDRGQALHFDGTAWSSVPTGVEARLGWISGSGPNDVWALLETYEGPLSLQHFDGSRWSSVSTGRTVAFVESIWVGSPNDLWITTGERDDDASTETKLRFVHFDGNTWSSVEPPWSAASTAASAWMWGAGPKDLWAVANSYDGDGNRRGLLAHYNGSTWSSVGLGPTNSSAIEPSAMWGAGPNLWIADARSTTLVRYDGTTWTSSPNVSAVAAGTALVDVWAAAPNDIWAVGTANWKPGGDGSGVLVHYDGHGWRGHDLPPISGLGKIHGSAANNVWAIGRSGIVVRYDGAAWTEVATGATELELETVWTSGPRDVWISGLRRTGPGSSNVSDAVALHFDGQRWTSLTPPELSSVSRVWGSAANDVWASGYGPKGFRLVHWGGSSWEQVPTPALLTLGGDVIWGTGPSDVWVGFRHFDGKEWKEAPSDSHVWFNSMWGPAPNDLWTITAMGEVLHFEGTRWSLVSTLQAGVLTGIGSELWAVGPGAAVLRKSLE